MKNDESNSSVRYKMTADLEKSLKKNPKNSEVNTLITAVVCGIFLAIAFILYLMTK